MIGPRFTLFFVLTVWWGLTGCGSDANLDDPAVQGWEGYTVDGDGSRTIRTTAGSVWDGIGTLTEEVAIGTETHGENDLLAEVVGIEFKDGLIYIADQILGTVRVYDMAGDHVADIGQPGEGPGEFRRITDVGIDTVRGHLVVRESAGVIHRLTLSGELVNRSPERFHYSFSREGLDLRVTRDGRVLFPQYHAELRPTFVRRFFLYELDSSGAPVDSLELPIESDQPYTLKAYVNPGTFRPEPVPFAPRELWTVGWDGSFISAFAEEYRIEIRYPNGTRTVIEREAEPIPVDADEREAHVRRVYEILRDVDSRWDWDGPEIPDFKPWLIDIFPDRSGRIWVLREGKGHPVDGWAEPTDWRGWKYDPEWESENWFEVFDEATGRYLGRVDTPEGFLLEPEPLIDGDLFLCLTKDEYDRPIVRRYRLSSPNTG
jgi:hypothetical protein